MAASDLSILDYQVMGFISSLKRINFKFHLANLSKGINFYYNYHYHSGDLKLIDLLKFFQYLKRNSASVMKGLNYSTLELKSFQVYALLKELVFCKRYE